MLKKLLYTVFLLGTLSAFSQEKVTIAWDTSLSMEERSLDKEFGFLDKYFAKYPEASARLILFNGIQATSKDFSITAGNWDEAKQELKDVTYDGASGYHTLTQAHKDGTTFLFTDGFENIEKDIPVLGNKLYLVNSKAEHDLKNLQFLALSNKGRLINLSPSLEKNIDDSNVYYGNVYGKELAMEMVSIGVKDSESKVSPTPDGAFKIEANPGDVLVVEVSGLPPIEQVITQNKSLNVWVRHQGVQLDEVLLKNKREKEEKLVNIGYNRVDKKSLGYAVQSVSAEEMNTGGGNMSSALNGKISGVGDGYATEISVAKIRQANSTLWAQHPLILIDGVPVPKSITRPTSGTRAELSNFIDVNNIADITVLKGFAATNQYGSEGSGGVILIKTKSKAAMDEAEDRRKENKVQKKITTYQGTASPPPPYTKAYLKSLEQQPTVEAAYSHYLEQREAFQDDPNYFVDLFDFFSSKNKEIAKTVGYAVLEKHSEDIGAMKAMLLKAKEKKYYDMELDFAKAMLEVHPDRIQSYMDLAKAQANNGNLQAALDLFLGITKGELNPNLDFGPLQKTADQEIRNLVAKHKESLELSKIAVSHLKKEPLEARIVFDWSEWDADFELIFISPSREFVSWKHTIENADRLRDEQLKGYLHKEFEIAGGQKGVWQVNAKYLGNRTSNNDRPVLLRCLVQYNFGKTNERTEEYIIRLFEKGSEQLAVRVMTQ